MIQKIKKIVAVLIILSVIAYTVPAGAFRFTDISKAGVQWQGTKDRPVQVLSESDALSKYMKIRGMNLGKMFYTLPDGGMIDQKKLLNMSKAAYPFLLSGISWYEYTDTAPYNKVYYIELLFYTPEYIEPAIEKAEEIVSQIAGPEKGYKEKVRAIHNYLIDNVEYDWDLYKYNFSDTKNVGFTAYGALINGKAVCEGYSSAFAILCHAAGVPAYLVTGKNGSGPHSWNLVYLYGAFYHIDVTGNDTSGEQYRYYMMTEKEIQKTHTINTETNRSVIGDLHNAGLSSAQILCELGLMRGTGDGFDLDKSPTRFDLAAMLTRLNGREAEAEQANYSHPFVDVPEWASPYIGYLYRSGLTNGASTTRYDGARAAVINDYLTFALRVLGYSDAGGGFTWETSISAAERIGLVPQGRYKSGAEITRGELAVISVKALVTKRMDGTYLIDSLVGSGAVSELRVSGVSPYLPER